MSMTETEKKILSWLKERKIFTWMVGTAIFTYLFVLLFYYLARSIGATIAVLKAMVPQTEWIIFQINATNLLYNAVGGIGLMSIIVIPALSFVLVRKFTNIFLIESEEKERWRQKELKRIIGDLKNARKMIWSMGFSKELSDAMYKKTQWDEPERAPVHRVIEILSEVVKKKKKEEPPKELREDEIKYLVQQKRKKASKLAKDLLEEERRRRHEELELLEELIEDVENDDELEKELMVDIHDELPLVEAAELVEAASEDEVVYHDINTHPVTRKMLEAEPEIVDVIQPIIVDLPPEIIALEESIMKARILGRAVKKLKMESSEAESKVEEELPDSEHERIHDSMEWHADPTPEEVTADAKAGEAALKLSEAESIKETIDILETIEAGDSYRELMADPEADVSTEIETLKVRLDEVQEENARASVDEDYTLEGLRNLVKDMSSDFDAELARKKED